MRNRRLCLEWLCDRWLCHGQLWYERNLCLAGQHRRQRLLQLQHAELLDANVFDADLLVAVASTIVPIGACDQWHAG